MTITWEHVVHINPINQCMEKNYFPNMELNSKREDLLCYREHLEILIVPKQEPENLLFSFSFY